MKRLSLQVFAVVLSLVAVSAASLETYSGFARIMVDAERSDQALAVLKELSELQSTLYEADQAVRGYMLSRDVTLLDLYKRAFAELSVRFGELRRLAADLPTQEARLDELAKVIETTKVQFALAATHGEGGTGILKTVRELMGQFHDLLAAAMTEETRSHALRADELERTTRIAVLGLLATVALSVLVIITVTLTTICEARRRIRTEQALQELNTALEDRVAAKTGELATVNELLQAIIRSSPLGIVALDEQKVVTTWSRRAEEILGVPASAMLGNRWTLFSDVGGTNFKALFARVAGGELMHGISVTHQRPDGRRLHIVLAAAPLYRRPNRRRGIVLVLEDATERRMVEDQLRQAQKMEAVGQLTGGLAHDFNNLLAVIIGNLSLVRDGSQLEVERDAVDAALKAALRGAELTRQLLVFARQQSLQPANIKLGDLVERTVELLRRSLGSAINIKVEVTPDLWTAHADPSQVESAIVNLALNARDAMPDGGSLQIELANATLDLDYIAQNPEAKPGEYVELSVSDTGTGIAAEILGRVFEPFFTTRPVGHGSGLGLSMVYGFAKQSGGHVRIDSSVGVGTCVRLYLPRARHGLELEKQTGIGGSPGRGQTILVVEDHAEVREVVCKQLTMLGYNIVDATDGREALQILSDGTAVDLLFTDVVMPGGLSGPELVAEARSLRPSLRVLYTSGFPEASRSGGLCGSGDPLLSKPYRLQDLARRIAAALKMDAMTEAAEERT
ncbi:MAG: ATP-binding protein [Rhodospirillales bacterium]